MYKIKKTNDVSIDKNKDQSRLTIMWILLILGYFIFIVQWYSVSNFSDAYNSTLINDEKANLLLKSMPNWTLTFMRGIGAFFTGYMIMKLGHKHSVIISLILVILSFPFIIFAAVPITNIDNNSGVSPVNFSMFLFFRLFLAIGGTTLITYTNSVIAKMNSEKRSVYMNLNTFGFNIGAFCANIIFCFGISKLINSTNWWIYISSFLIIVSFIIFILYLIIGIDVVPKKIKIESFNNIKNTTFLSVLKEKFTWKMASLFVSWLLISIFFTSGSVRQIIEKSPANFNTLIQWNILNKDVLFVPETNSYKWITSIGKTTLSTQNYVVVGSGYEWVWPTYICLFVSGIFAGYGIISQFNKTIYKRPKYIIFVFSATLVCTFISFCAGYFGGYGNKIWLTIFLLFIFLSGIFIWSIQPVLLSLYQLTPESDSKYVGIISGIVWGIGYLSYTLNEIVISMSISYIDPVIYDSTSHIKNTLNDLINNNTMYVGKPKESTGTIISTIILFLVPILTFIPAFFLSNFGYKDKNGNFVEFTKTWHIMNWNFWSEKIKIKE